MHNNLKYCKICGLEQEKFPWGEDGKTPNFDICDCCGVEFGYEDYTLVSLNKFRQEWLSSGGIWFEKEAMPENWDMEEQMENVSGEYL